MIFEFVSDDDDSVAEGFYLDDVRISGNIIYPVSVHEEKVEKKLFSIFSSENCLKVVSNRPYLGEVHVYDGAGRLVFKHPIKQGERLIKISDLHAGVYFIKIGREIGKVIFVK